MLASIQLRQTEMKGRTLASRKFPRHMLNEVLNEDAEELMEYIHLIEDPKYREIWGQAYGNKLGRLAQGMEGRVKGTNTIFFIPKEDLPSARWKDVTYGRIVVNYHPEKINPNRVRLTVGGDRINYPGDCGTPTADMLTVKLLINSFTSTKGVKFMSIDIEDFCLNTPMSRYEYMRLKIAELPQDLIDEYKLQNKETKDGYFYLEIRKGMYGLPQAGILAKKILENY